MAQITRVDLFLVNLVPQTERRDAIQAFECQETPVLTLTDSDGVSGTGYCYTIGAGGSSVVALLRDRLLPRLIGADPDNIERIWRDLRASVNALTIGPIASLALATIDIALWDLRGRKTGLPLHRLAGGANERVPVYSTEGGWLQLSAEALCEDAARRQSEGFHGAKIKVGRPHLHEDQERLEAVRETVGPAWDIMVDANQSFHCDEAMRRANAFAHVDLAWFEEPLPADDISGHANLARHTPVPIAVGESLYSIRDFRHYLQQDACSVVQVDVARIGGITPWLKVAHLAECYNVPVAPHFLMEIHVSLVCAVPNGSRLEYIPQLGSIMANQVVIVDGYAYPPTAPGVGIEWDWEMISHLAVDKVEATS
jgi:L-alanine-DL-glutamate epimerase-like enolase superfamily enzyme